MKRILLSLSMILLCFFGNTQRSIDLELIITSHADGDIMVTEGPIVFTAEVINLGTETLEASDSVCYYILIYNDSFDLSLGAENYALYTGITSAPSQSFQATQTIGFSNTFNGETTDLCVYAKPMNSTSPISDPVLTNNKNCVSITFIDESELSVATNQTGLIQLTPNPANDYFNLTGVDENAFVSVMDVQGNRVDFNWKNGEKIDCSTWSNGVYLLKVTNANGTSVKKFLVAHE